MSSYHASFTYNGINSATDKHLLVAAFEPDNGLKDTFLSMDVISDEYYDGTKKYTYNSKYNSQAVITITVVNSNGRDFSLAQTRECLKWLTGAKIDSWLDMYSDGNIVYSFLGRVTNVQQYKMDGRVVGLTIEFSSVSPWAFSAPQVFDCAIGQALSIDASGEFTRNAEDNDVFGYEDGVVTLSALDKSQSFNLSSSGVLYVDTSYETIIDNKSDDLYTYIYLDIEYINEKGNMLSVNNLTLGEETVVDGMTDGEVVYISAKQFITSDRQGKIFGDSFNWVWPRLAPGLNDLVISGAGTGRAKFTYRYPMKVGDCAMDISVYGGNEGCGEMATYNTIKWDQIIETPTSIGGYGIQDAYTMVEVDERIENNGSANIDEKALNDMLSSVLG